MSRVRQRSLKAMEDRAEGRFHVGGLEAMKDRAIGHHHAEGPHLRCHKTIDTCHITIHGAWKHL
jgi:hypothetical protein